MRSMIVRFNSEKDFLEFNEKLGIKLPPTQKVYDYKSDIEDIESQLEEPCQR